jgi:predicted AAA+ superfamily ATPase
MLRQLAVQNKAERDDYLARPLVERDGTGNLRRQLGHRLTKVVVGPRRAGKSMQCFLALKGERFAYLNFDDERLLGVEDYDEIPAVLTEVYGAVDYYFFDEIQNLPKWELFVNKLQRRGRNLVLTGSNSKLLSRELGSALTGRHQLFELLPLGLGEFLRFRDLAWDADSMCLPEKRGQVLRAAAQYLAQGGFPEVVIDGIAGRDYLGTLLDAILYKDIVARHDIRSPRLLTELCLYLLTNFAREYTFNSLRNAVGAASVATVEDYVAHLEEAFLIFSLQRYDFKIKETIRAPRKVYAVDNGFIAARARRVSEDHGRLLENAVFLELVRQGRKVNRDLFHYRTGNNLEVDFLLLDGTRPQNLIQVCHTLDDAQTKARELKALAEAEKELRGPRLTIVTWGAEATLDQDGLKVSVVPFWKFCTGAGGKKAT